MGQAMLREAGENYLEAILEIQAEGQGVRSIDVANRIGVSRPSVNRALRTLKDAGMVLQEPYGLISLTEMGRNRAEEVSRRHTIIKRFLTEVLSVDKDTSDVDACRMEHVVSPETMTALVEFLQKYLK